MKQSILLSIFIFTCIITFSQSKIKDNKTFDSTFKRQNNENVVYKLFPTQNMWTFIKLNTKNGKLWQVQFDIKDNNRFEVSLSLIPLVDSSNELTERFTLYPTQNIYTFILLDQVDGRMWQVQWSTETTKRVIIPIE